jgi:hypothetical protein
MLRQYFVMSSPGRTVAAGARYALWISDKDENGVPVDPRFIEAAYALEHSFFNYRQRELGCESVTATLIQSAVNAASRAAHSKPVDNPGAYLMTAFMRKVDKYLAQSAIEVAVADEFIEDLTARSRDLSAWTKRLEDFILLGEVKSYMDAWTRSVCNMRAAGYSFEELARDLGEPTNRVMVRYWRGLKRAADKVFQSKPIIENRKGDG